MKDETTSIGEIKQLTADGKNNWWIYLLYCMQMKPFEQCAVSCYFTDWTF